MTFRVGQKVVCIDGDFSSYWSVVKHLPEKGRVYTVRALTECTFGPFKDVPCILLQEIRNPVQLWSNGRVFECPFTAKRFRPVVERKTDISFAHEILRKVSRNNRVRA